MKKDLEWLKEEIKVDIDNLWFTDRLNTRDTEVLTARINTLIDQVEQLDYDTIFDEGYKSGYKTGKNHAPEPLEKPVVPEYVNEWIKNNRHEGWWRKIAEWEYEVPKKDRKVYDWYQNYNENKFILAWITGDYTVEEKKYSVEDDSGDSILCKVKGNLMTVGKAWAIGYEKELITYELTEQEIKDYDERYWPFAKEVTNEIQSGR